MELGFTSNHVAKFTQIWWVCSYSSVHNYGQRIWDKHGSKLGGSRFFLAQIFGNNILSSFCDSLILPMHTKPPTLPSLAKPTNEIFVSMDQ